MSALVEPVVPAAVASPPVSPNKVDKVDSKTDVHLQQMKEAFQHGKDSTEFQEAVFDALIHGALVHKDKIVTANMAGIQFVTEIEDPDAKTTTRFLLLGKQNKGEDKDSASYDGTWASFGGKPVSGKPDKKDKEMAQFDLLKTNFPKFLDHFHIHSFEDWVNVEKTNTEAVAIRETWEEMNGAASFEDLLAWVERPATRASCNNGLLDFGASLVGGDPFDRFLFASVNYLVPVSPQEIATIMINFMGATKKLIAEGKEKVEVSQVCLMPTNVFSRGNKDVDALFQPDCPIKEVKVESGNVQIGVVDSNEKDLTTLVPGVTMSIAAFKVRDAVIWEKPLRDLVMTTGSDVDSIMVDKQSTD